MEKYANLFSTNARLYNLITKLKNKPYKFFYKNIIPKFLRKNLEEKADYAQQNFIANCWNKIISDASALDSIPEIKPKKELKDEKIIWQYWGQGWDFDKLPTVVKLSYLSVDKYKADYKVIRLDNENIFDYLEFPKFVLDKINQGDFKLVFFSDLLRLALLKYYGGVWVDSTILLTEKIPNELLEMPYFCFQRDYAISQSKKQIWYKKDKTYFSWYRNFKINSLNSFLISKKNNDLISKMLELILFFWKSQNKITHYFFFQILYDCLVENEFSNEKCLVIDDTLPHDLQFKIKENKPFDIKEYKEIINASFVHKLTYFEGNNSPYFLYLKSLYKLK